MGEATRGRSDVRYAGGGEVSEPCCKCGCHRASDADKNRALIWRLASAFLIWSALLLIANMLLGCSDDEALLYDTEPLPYTCNLGECCDLLADVVEDGRTYEAIRCIDLGQWCELDALEPFWECSEGIDRATLRAALIAARIDIEGK